MVIIQTTFRSHCGYYDFLTVSFGLTNAPTLLMDLMDYFFRSYFNLFVIVFLEYTLGLSLWDHHLHTMFLSVRFDIGV